METKITVGRIVMYTNHGDALGVYPPIVVPAIVTKINNEHSVSLTIFNPMGLFINSSVLKSDFQAGAPESRGKWSWPEM